VAQKCTFFTFLENKTEIQKVAYSGTSIIIFFKVMPFSTIIMQQPSRSAVHRQFNDKQTDIPNDYYHALAHAC